MEYIASFYTNSGAIKFAKLLPNWGWAGELIPMPRKLTSSCGMGVRFSFTGDIMSLVSSDMEKIHRVNGQKYILVYCDED